MFKNISRNNHVLTLGMCVLFSGFVPVQQFLTLYFTEVGEPEVGFMTLIILFLFFGTSSLFIGPQCVSTMGLKSSLVISALCHMLFGVSLLTKNVPIVYVCSIITGIGAGIMWTAQGVYILRAAPQDHASENTSYFFSCFSCASFVGVTIFGFLKDTFNFHIALMSVTGIGFCSLFFFLVLEDLTMDTTPHTSVLYVLTLLKDKTIAKIAFYCFFTFLLWGFIFGQMPLEIQKHLGNAYVKYFVSLYFIIFFLIAFPLGKLTDTLGYTNVLLTVLGTVVISLLVLSVSINNVLFVIGLLGIAICFSVMRPLTQSLPRILIPSENLKYLIGLLWCTQTIGIICAQFMPLVLEHWLQLHDYADIMYACMMCIGMISTWMIFGVRQSIAEKQALTG